MRVAILGFGLIGGSIARAIAASGSAAAWELTAWTPTGRGPTAALRDGVIAEAAPTAADAVRGAALVVLAGPPNACIDMLDDLAGPLRPILDPAVVVTDVASTKVAITLRAAALDLPFVGGHPMAGLERSGYEASSGDLFVHRPWIIVPSAAPERDARVRALAVVCGARPMSMTAAAHDRAVAAISHLPLIAAASLVDSVLRGDALDEADRVAARTLAAGGWRDMTRLARGDIAMGTGIAVTNAAALAERIRAYVAVLEAWLVDLEAPGGPDRDAIEIRLQSARAALEERS